MIVRNLSDEELSERRIISPDGNWESTRLLLKKDKIGFSFHITTIYKDADFYMHYQNHLEAVYCISGRGEVQTIVDKKIYPVNSGTFYCLNKNDKHILRAFTEMKMACVFNPALTGKETHNKEGSYDLNDDSYKL